MATTYNNLFLDTRARLKKAGVESAQLEAREIICFAADKSREQFYRDMSLYVGGAMEQRVEELADQFGTIAHYIIESLKYATIRAPEEEGTPKEDFTDDKVRSKYIEKFMMDTREKRLKAGKTLLRGLHFINSHAQELRMMPKLELDPELLEQPLYH